jgi:hypothetical protein
MQILIFIFEGATLVKQLISLAFKLLSALNVSVIIIWDGAKCIEFIEIIFDNYRIIACAFKCNKYRFKSSKLITRHGIS